MSEEAITLGTVVNNLMYLASGAVIGFAGSRLNAWRQRRQEAKENAINMILDVVKYILKMNTMAHDITEIMRRFQLQKAHTKNQEEASQVAKEHREVLLKIREKVPELAVEELFREVQLDLVGDQNIRKKFRPLINAFNEYFEAFNVDAKLHKEKEAVYRKLYKEFINLCVNTCKANAPIRALSAPGKKKTQP